MRKIYFLLLTVFFAAITNAQCPTIAPGNNPRVCAGATSAQLSYTSTNTGPTATYNIVWSGPAITAGFVNVTNASLPLSPITITVPAGAPPATYNGTLNVTDNSCTSSNESFSVIISSVPTLTLGSNPSICTGTTSAPLPYTATGTGTVQQISNGDFETGFFPTWIIRDNTPTPIVSTLSAHTGVYSAFLGNLPGSEPFGDASIYQEVTIPSNGGTLSYWYQPYTEDAIFFDWQDAYVTDLNGNILATIMHVCNTSGWTNVTYDMSAFAGQTVRIEFLVHQDGFGDVTNMYVDDVTLTTTTTYSITWSAAAITAGFVNVTNAPLPASPISLVVPGAAAPGTYNGTISITNGTGCSIPSARSFTVTINQTPNVNPVSNQTVCNGSQTSPVTFSGSVPGTTFNWTNSTPSIGLPASGSGNIAAFTAVNGGAAPVTATITVTPRLSNNLMTNSGFETGNFTGWTILSSTPAPVVNTTSPHSGTYAAFLGSLSSPEPLGNAAIYQTVTVDPGGGTLSFWYKPFTTDNITFDWQDVYVTNTSGTILATIMHVCQTNANYVNVNYNMAAFAGQTVRIEFLVHQDGFGDVTNMYVDDVTLSGPLSCTGTPQSFTITVNPTPTVNTVPNQTVCNGSTVGPINFSGPVAGTTFNWTNNNTSIGLAASGSGNIAAFTATNAGTAPVSATVTVTPTTGGGGNLVTNGDFETGSLAPWTILSSTPAPVVNSTSPHSGTYAAFLGNLPGPEANGNSAMYQQVTVPAGGSTLSFWYKGFTQDGITFDWQDVYITNTSGTILATIMHVCQTNASYVNVNYNMAAFAGQTVRIEFLVHQDGFGDVTNMYVDDVTLVSNSSCSGPPQSFTITVNPTPNVSPVANQTVCNGSSTTAVNFSGTVPGTVFNWTNNNTTIGLAASGSGNIPSFTAVNNGAAPVTATITVTPTYSTNLINNGGFETGSLAGWTTLSSTPAPTVNATSPHSGTYAAFLGSLSAPEPNGNAAFYQTITVPAGGGTLSYWYKPFTTDNITFDWQDAYITNTSGTILATIMHVCQTNANYVNINYNLAAFAGQTVRVEFLVHQDGFGDVTNMYVDDVTLTGSACTGVQQSFTITVNPSTKITSQPTGTTVCAGNNVVFTVGASGVNITYQWQISTDGGTTWTNIAGANNNNLTLNNVTAAMNNNQYRCVVSGTCGTVNSNAAVLLVYSPATITTQPANVAACVGTNATFTVAATGTSVSYQWQLSTDGGTTYNNLSNNATYNNVNTATLSITGVTATMNNYKYRVIVSNSCASVTSNAVTLTVNPLPVVSVTALTSRLCISDTLVPLVGSPVGGVWSGIGVYGNNFLPYRTAPGVYTLTYTFTNSNNCTASATTTANVQDCPERARFIRDKGVIIYPNPNNGQFNLRINTTLYNYLGMRVYNTAGQLLNMQSWSNLQYGRVIPIDLSRLAGGVYQVKLFYDDGIRTEEKTFNVVIVH